MTEPIHRLTEDIACAAIMDSDRQRRSIVLPRFTPSGWWECDVFELTPSGYFREYEVKLTLADFKADAKKSRQLFFGYGNPREKQTKHQRIQQADAKGPAQFYFVTPENLIPPGEIPEWAGHIELMVMNERHSPTRRYFQNTVKTAPRLHKDKADPKIRAQCLAVCYYRFHHIREALVNRTTMPVTWPDDLPVMQPELPTPKL